MEALAFKHGWTRKERPLIVDVSRVTHEPRNKECPDCHMPTDEMERASPADAMMLNVNLQASGSRNRGAGQYKAENAELSKTLREISARLAKIEGGKK